MSCFFIIFLVLSPVNAYIYTEEDEGNLEVSVGGNPFLVAVFENTTEISQVGISDANFTTANHTFPYHAAYKITYKSPNGTDYLITWKCDNLEYLDDYVFKDFYNFYSGYLSDNKTPIYMEFDDDYVYGIILDTENISYTEANLVYSILGKYGYALSDSVYPTTSGPVFLPVTL